MLRIKPVLACSILALSACGSRAPEGGNNANAAAPANGAVEGDSDAGALPPATGNADRAMPVPPPIGPGPTAGRPAPPPPAPPAPAPPPPGSQPPSSDEPAPATEDEYLRRDKTDRSEPPGWS